MLMATKTGREATCNEGLELFDKSIHKRCDN